MCWEVNVFAVWWFCVFSGGCTPFMESICFRDCMYGKEMGFLLRNVPEWLQCCVEKYKK